MVKFVELSRRQSPWELDPQPFCTFCSLDLSATKVRGVVTLTPVEETNPLRDHLTSAEHEDGVGVKRETLSWLPALRVS